MLPKIVYLSIQKLTFAVLIEPRSLTPFLFLFIYLFIYLFEEKTSIVAKFCMKSSERWVKIMKFMMQWWNNYCQDVIDGDQSRLPGVQRGNLLLNLLK